MPSVIAQIQVVREWAPLLTLLSAVRASTTQEAKAQAVLAVAKWLAAKTNTRLDDDLLAWLGVALALPEAAAILRWLEHLGTVVALEPPPVETQS